MAALSQTATTLTPPTSSDGPGYSWDVSASNHAENHFQATKTQVNDENGHASARSPLTSQNGNSAVHNSNVSIDAPARKQSFGKVGSVDSIEHSYLSTSHQKDPKFRNTKENGSPAESLLELYGTTRSDRGEESHKRVTKDTFKDPETDDSKWIHRDKLARIESEELQAAGFILPKARERARSKSQNRARRDHSQDNKVNGQTRAIGGAEPTTTRSRKNSLTAAEPSSPEASSVPSWDLRLPEEIAAEAEGYWVSNGAIKGSKIPVAKLSPVPIPPEHIERDKLLVRKRDSSPGEDDNTINYPKPRTRSGSTGNVLAKMASNGTLTQPASQPALQSTKRADSSPKKGTPTAGGRKTSGAKPANGAAGRPKTRGQPSKDSTTSSGGATTRPSTRSGERELSIGSGSKQMEGEPPWMVSAYRPDPRLPPDQQLLPTVAKRLQQEKWEKEGKFGSIYDREFRPLTDEGFLKPPEPDVPTTAEKEGGEQEKEGEWPLKQEQPPKSPSLPGRTNSYSTMPKIADKPALSPLPSPRTPAQQQPQPSSVIRVPEPPEDSSQKKGGCACCIVM
ncbi:hypothetical protein QBC46DRAFT_363832 [Diplogelasinospora grovesii]|uniref:TeaA receptor TeaR n=1 Tax=Diplogelasinospora grovesii TaxID=303347 RepID=A0AAN6S4I2_9PEZI|nr:hypothetical protein QBC46DRAFT_363832 [Diplogelasinospora grovesii]